MPVEIRELIIRAVATAPPDSTEPVARAVDVGPDAPAAGDDQQALIQACVRQVLRILEQKQER
jgi:hypothetical protein